MRLTYSVETLGSIVRPGAFWTLKDAEPDGGGAERAGAGVGLRIAASSVCWLPAKFTVPVLFVLATIAPLL